MIWVILGIVLLLWLASQSGKPRSAQSTRNQAPKRPAPSARSYVSPAPTRQSGNDAPNGGHADPGRWIPKGETVNIAGLSIDGGMIYVGGQLPKPVGYGDENCLIDPTLRVAARDADMPGHTMSYWPAYGSIDPRARLAYLQWLASGRSAPDVGIGYVFLFFYGLERRVFVDRATEDYAAIRDEVRRLLELYHQNNSFNGYARRFLALLDVFHDRGAARPELRLELRNGFELPLDVRFYLGGKLKVGEPLSAEDALLWAVAMPDTNLRTPAMRCLEELRSLWSVKFAEKWPDGLRVRPPQTTLKLSYRSASGTFQGSFEADGLPDIAAVQAPLSRLRDLLSACTEELDPYSRLIGKRPEARGTLEAVALLPKALVATKHGASASQAKARIMELCADQAISIVLASRVFELLGLRATGGFQDLGPVLDYLDIGFEPDRRYGGLASSQGEHMVLFKTDDHRLPADLDEFKGCRTLVEIAILGAAADGVVDATEFEVVKDEIRVMPGLTEAERLRLHAYAFALAKNPPKSQGVLNRAGRLEAAKRDMLVQAATSAILADGCVTPDEVKYLERLYKALGLPTDAVYAALHRGAGGRDEPVTVVEARSAPGAPIPPLQKPGPSGVSIDIERLSRVREQTAAVSSLLSEIFTEDPSAQSNSAIEAIPAGQTKFPGLEARHGELLASLLKDGGWTWSDFETQARALRLMPEGALETINDWAFELFDEPLLEAGDTVAPAEHLRTQVRELETAA